MRIPNQNTFYAFSISLCFVIVFSSISGCATPKFLVSSKCEDKTDPIERYQCLDERYFPDVAKGVTIGAASGALLGWLIHAAIGGHHTALIMIIGATAGAVTGGVVAYGRNQQDKQKATFDILADMRNLDKLTKTARLAFDETNRKLKAGSITREEAMKIAQQFKKDGESAMKTCRGDELVKNNILSQSDEDPYMLDENVEACYSNSNIFIVQGDHYDGNSYKNNIKIDNVKNLNYN